MESARENRLLIGKGGMFGNVIRITPPLDSRRVIWTSSRRGWTQV
jgi:4-aminobutyrate aminotransferase-like enzyme